MKNKSFASSKIIGSINKRSLKTPNKTFEVVIFSNDHIKLPKETHIFVFCTKYFWHGRLQNASCMEVWNQFFNSLKVKYNIFCTEDYMFKIQMNFFFIKIK